MECRNRLEEPDQRHPKLQRKAPSDRQEWDNQRSNVKGLEESDTPNEGETPQGPGTTEEICYGW